KRSSSSRFRAMIGQTLGHYRILAKLGVGGMGVVYRASDTMLQRPAAVKVIEGPAGADETARARLLREARMASALNHPNICTVYEVGVAGPADAIQTYIAMELIEGAAADSSDSSGGTADRPDASLRDADCRRAGSRARRGVIHQDLKSANVMVLPDGRIKVL